MRPKKSTLLGADGGPCCSSERSRTAPIACPSPKLCPTRLTTIHSLPDEPETPRDWRQQAGAAHWLSRAGRTSMVTGGECRAGRVVSVGGGRGTENQAARRT